MVLVPAAGAGAGAQTRHVVVVGDSILLGARDQLASQFTRIGWTATLDMSVSRSTLAGLEAIEAHRGELGDSLVIGLGANDAGNVEQFRARVERVLNAVSGVPNVYWVTIAEVRPYYPAANQVLRDLASVHPNVRIIEWAAYAASTPTVAASDGLHLTGSGAVEMANLISLATVIGTTPGPAPRAATATTTSTTMPTTTTSTSTTTTSTTTTTSSTTTTTMTPTTTAPPAVVSQARPASEGGWSPMKVVLLVVALIVATLGTWLVISAKRAR